MKTALILYPHQLFAPDLVPQVDTVVLVEEPLYFGLDSEQPNRLHKQKLILHRASMRRYAEEVLWPRSVNVDYVELDGLRKTGDILDRVKKFEKVYIFDPVDETLTHRLLEARRKWEGNPTVEFLQSPNFYLKDSEIRQYFAEKHTGLFSDFYQWQRERFNILIGEDYKPIGGKWMFEPSDKQPEKEAQLPSFGVFGDNKWVQEATQYVNEHFGDNPGDSDCIWPTSHVEAATWLNDFVEKRLDKFADYQNLIRSDAVWLHHSALSSSLNIGLLSPSQVVQAALARHTKQAVPLESLESFVRMILGWREFTRGQYIAKSPAMQTANPLKHQRKLTAAWYDGNLGIPPFDTVLTKLKQHGYVHNSERLLIVGGLMTLCEIDPGDITKWFKELSIDSYDWALVPNVWALSQLGDPGVSSRAAVVPSSTIIQLSGYARGEWSDVWDGLFWRFVDKHKDSVNHNPRMRTLIHRLGRLDADHRRIISYRAEDFLAKSTR